MLRAILQPFYTGYVVIVFLATLLLVLPFYLLFSIFSHSFGRKPIWRLTWLWSKICLRTIGMWVKTTGIVPRHKKYIVIANHVSYLDPIAVYDVVPFFFRPLAKYELSKIPVFGFVYAQIALLVDRSSATKRANSMLQMHKTLKEECSIFMYPEGTFNETAEPMKSFYDGAFRLAVDTQTDILPIIFPDTNKRWTNTYWWKMWPGKNRAYVLQPVSVATLQMDDIPDLKEKIRSIMGQKLLELSSSSFN
ncbi:MAG: lysophospholipid acyltransferase family protein [Phycisphaerales bacterium]|nr:lysophospholipid acyltransferase family protein [Phycisphaerales bacterium]